MDGAEREEEKRSVTVPRIFVAMRSPAFHDPGLANLRPVISLDDDPGTRLLLFVLVRDFDELPWLPRAGLYYVFHLGGRWP